MSDSTALPDEIARFQAIADGWWDSKGKFKPLHKINPPRIDYIASNIAKHFDRDLKSRKPLAELSLIDVGCGGGLLSEPLARLGLDVTGIDAGEKNISIARDHAVFSNLTIDYRVATPEMVQGQQFDIVCAMEIIEHVADPQFFLEETIKLLRPGGLFFGSTINRTAKSWVLAILGAEYILRWVPVGTHDWQKFLKPSEFAKYLRQAGIKTTNIEGISYNPMNDCWKRTTATDVNYQLVGVKW